MGLVTFENNEGGSGNEGEDGIEDEEAKYRYDGNQDMMGGGNQQ